MFVPGEEYHREFQLRDEIAVAEGHPPLYQPMLIIPVPYERTSWADQHYEHYGDLNQGDEHYRGLNALALPVREASGMLLPRNHWVARAWLGAAGERTVAGLLLTIVVLLLLAAGRVVQPAGNGKVEAAPMTSALPSTTQPPATTAPTGTVAALDAPMLSNVVSGIVPVVADVLAQPLAQVATAAAATPAELKTLALENGVAPFLKAGSTKLGDALAGAIARWTRLTPSAKAATPPKEATLQVQRELQEALEVELRSRPEVVEMASRVGRTTDEVARELATAIAQGLAGDLAQGLTRVPPSQDLNDPFLATIVRALTEQLAKSASPRSLVPNGPL